MALVPSPPEGFTLEFLDWFRSTTEAAWPRSRANALKRVDPSTIRSLPWTDPGSWQDGLSDDEIDAVERTWAVRFPPDHRLFLRHLHAPARPAGMTWEDAWDLPLYQRPFFCASGFYDWRLDSKELREAFSAPLDGLLFEVECADLWLLSWGEKPTDLEARKRRLAGLVGHAPRLIPVLANKYLVAEPCQEGNPVLSIHQSDMIVFGTDLRDFFIRRFRGSLFPGQPLPDIPATSMDRVMAIPFWGEFFKPNSRVQ